MATTKSNRPDILARILAILGVLIAVSSLGWQVWEYFARRRADAPAVAITGRFCHVLTQDHFRDVLNALYEACPMMSIEEKLFRSATNIVPRLRESFVDRSQFRLFRVRIDNTHNVPVSLSDLAVRHVCIASQNTNMIVRDVDVFVATGAPPTWETRPVINLAPHETRQIDVVVSFIAVDRVTDGTDSTNRPPLSLAEWRNRRFSQVQFQSVRFSFRDNIGREHLSGTIPICDAVIRD